MESPWRMGSHLDTKTVETSFYNIFKCHCGNKLESSHPLVPMVSSSMYSTNHKSNKKPLYWAYVNFSCYCSSNNMAASPFNVCIVFSGTNSQGKDGVYVTYSESYPNKHRGCWRPGVPPCTYPGTVRRWTDYQAGATRETSVGMVWLDASSPWALWAAGWPQPHPGNLSEFPFVLK